MQECRSLTQMDEDRKKYYKWAEDHPNACDDTKRKYKAKYNGVTRMSKKRMPGTTGIPWSTARRVTQVGGKGPSYKNFYLNQELLMIFCFF